MCVCMCMCICVHVCVCVCVCTVCVYKIAQTSLDSTNNTLNKHRVLGDLRVILYIMYTFYIQTLLNTHSIPNCARFDWYRTFGYLTVAFLQTVTSNHISCTSRITAEKLTVPQLVKKFPAFYGNRRSLLQPQQPSTCSYPKPDQTSPCPCSHF